MGMPVQTEIGRLWLEMGNGKWGVWRDTRVSQGQIGNGNPVIISKGEGAAQFQRRVG